MGSLNLGSTRNWGASDAKAKVVPTAWGELSIFAAAGSARCGGDYTILPLPALTERWSTCRERYYLRQSLGQLSVTITNDTLLASQDQKALARL